MNPLNPFALSGILMASLYLPLALFIFRKSKTKAAKVYAGYLFTVGMWGLGAIFIALIKNIVLIKFIWKLTYSFVLFIPPLFYHTVHDLTKRKAKWDLILVYGQATFFTATIYCDLMMANFRIMFNSFYFHIATPTFTTSFIIWTFIIGFGHQIFLTAFNKMFPEEQAQFREIWILTLIGFMGGITNFFPAYGLNIYPWGNFIAISPCFAISYAIFKYQFLDIRIVIKKSLAYSILILIAVIMYLGIVITLEKFIQGYWGYKSVAISITTAFAIGVVFFPLHSYIQQLIDKFIFKKTTEEISNENQLLRAEVVKSEKLKYVALLASGMAHEIKNPLTAIKTFSEFLPQKLNDKEFLLKFSKIVGSEVNRIDALVNELLEFAKPAPLQVKETNLNKLITDTIDLLNSKLLMHNITVEFDLSPECSSPMLLDPSKMRQALLNIILNAIDAMPNGGTLTITVIASEASLRGTSTAKQSEKQIATSSPAGTPRNGRLTVAIADTGCGIPKENLSKIFDPFFSTKDAGTGLGLPITHGIIKDHGGEIKVQSEVGKGTKFIIILPNSNSP